MQKIYRYYLEMEFSTKDKVKSKFLGFIKWDSKRKKWFTNCKDKLEEMKKFISNYEKVNQRIKKLEKSFQSITEMILDVFPPNTPERQKIVEEHLSDKLACFEALKAESESRMNKMHLKIVSND